MANFTQSQKLSADGGEENDFFFRLKSDLIKDKWKRKKSRISQAM